MIPNRAIRRVRADAFHRSPNRTAVQGHACAMDLGARLADILRRKVPGSVAIAVPGLVVYTGRRTS